MVSVFLLATSPEIHRLDDANSTYTIYWSVTQKLARGTAARTAGGGRDAERPPPESSEQPTHMHRERTR
eukprot:1183418-Prorocentrum_minimum.AAC.10